MGIVNDKCYFESMTQFTRHLEPPVFRKATQTIEVSYKYTSFESHIHLECFKYLSQHFTHWSIHIPVLMKKKKSRAQSINISVEHPEILVHLWHHAESFPHLWIDP